MKIEEIEKYRDDYVVSRHVVFPVIDQYIKARRFVVTEEFVRKVEEKLEIIRNKGSGTGEAICQTVLDQLWAEVEGE